MTERRRLLSPDTFMASQATKTYTVDDIAQPDEGAIFLDRRHAAYNPFRGLIASFSAMALIFCIPAVLAWTARPLLRRAPAAPKP